MAPVPAVATPYLSLRGWPASTPLSIVGAGGVVMAEKDLSPARPVAPIDYTAALSGPILGLFGEDDSSPTPEQVAQHEEALKKHGKEYEFHMYPDAGHGFFYHHRPNYRQKQATDGWQKTFAFLKKHLS